MSKFNRSQYMNKEVSHRDYYRQFVTPAILAIVREKMGAKLAVSYEPNLNDIQLTEPHWHNAKQRAQCGSWDSLHPLVRSEVLAGIRGTGEGNSMSTFTCILKEAGRVIQEEGMHPLRFLQARCYQYKPNKYDNGDKSVEPGDVFTGRIIGDGALVTVHLKDGGGILNVPRSEVERA